LATKKVSTKKTTAKKAEVKKPEVKKPDMEKRWKRYQEMTGYTDEELKTFRSFPQNIKAMEDSPEMVRNDVVFEVLKVRNCIAGYKKGDTFRVDPFGFLMKDECPPNLCTGAIFAFKPLIGYAWQALMDGSKLLFHRTIRCPDVGVEHEGTGEILLKAYIVPRGEKWDPKKHRK
jgi:hypothetical protein